MQILLRIGRALALREFSHWRNHYKARLKLTIAFVIFLVTALFLAIALGLVALAQTIGVLAALAWAFGVAVALCILLGLALVLENQRHARIAARQAAERRQLLETALVSALPEMSLGAAAAVGLGVMAFTIWTGRGK